MTLTAFALDGMVAVPAVLAVLTLLVARRSEAGAVRVAAWSGLLVLGWSIWLAALSSSRLDGTHVNEPWLAAIDVRWHLGVDGISLQLLLMSTVVFACARLALVRNAPEGGGTASLAVLLLVIEAGVLGSFLALDMVLFFAFFEVALIPMWFVIDRWGDAHGPRGEEQRRRAATRFLVFTVGGAVM